MAGCGDYVIKKISGNNKKQKTTDKISEKQKSRRATQSPCFFFQLKLS